MISRERIAAIILRDLFDGDPDYMSEALSCADSILEEMRSNDQANA